MSEGCGHGIIGACTRCQEDRERKAGREARIRAAGMYALLIEVRESNAARDLDDDLLSRLDRAIADQERATASPTHDTHLLDAAGMETPGGNQQ